MKKAVLAMMLMAGGLFAAPRFSVGIGIGAPAPVAVARPAYPGPGYAWVDGYYASDGYWVAGYWAPPAVVVAPRYDHDRDDYRVYNRDRDDNRRFDVRRGADHRDEHSRR